MSGPAFWESLVKTGRAIYFPNIPLRLVAPSQEAAERGLNVVTFITVPSTTKTEVKNLLQTVYKVGVERVHTINYEGKKKKSKSHNYYYNRPDYKKVYVQLREKWFPPQGFAIKPVEAEATDKKKKHKPKRSPVKSGPKSYWLTNDEGTVDDKTNDDDTYDDDTYDDDA